MPKEKLTFASDFKRFFVRGLGILLPSVLTLWIVWQAYLFLDRQVAEPINSGIRRVVLWSVPQAFKDSTLPSWFVVSDEEIRQYKATLQSEGTLQSQAMRQLPDEALREQWRAVKLKRFWDSHWYFRFIGLIVAVSLIYLAGRTLGGYIGRKTYRRVEAVLTRLPVFKQVYPHVKQVVDMIFGEQQIAFKRVVMVEYPRKGIWSLGFVTSTGMRSISGVAGEGVVTVFIPSTPTPFTGFTITVKESEAIHAPISVDEALRFVLTGGVLVPGKQAVHAPDIIGEAIEKPGLSGVPDLPPAAPPSPTGGRAGEPR